MIDPGPGFGYSQPTAGPGIGDIVSGILLDPLVMYPIGTGLLAGRGMTASLFKVKGGALFSSTSRGFRIERATRRAIGAKGFDHGKLVQARINELTGSSKYAKVDFSKLSDAEAFNINKKIRVEAIKSVNADSLSKRELRGITRGIDKRMQRANISALRTPGGAGSTYRRTVGQVGRGLRVLAGAMVIAEISTLIGGAVLNTIKEGAIRGRELRSSDNLNPYANFGQSQEAYTQRMEAVQAMQRLPGMMRRMGNEARMYHS